ncbi:MAG TPA: glycosyltransferase [Mycobacteriales bacterium]|jgi:UDP:flavonoid glycosyltransferase YjiC (YdhE family)|nr:glycosyltransferase [Mycobacteriales bacterium]
MRVLVSCIPQTGHLFPLLPLADAFTAQGDEVLVASGADAADAVTARGLRFREAGPPFGEWFAALQARTRGLPGDGLAPDRVERYFLPRLFGEVGTALVVDHLMATAADFRPDLLVFDPVMFAAPLVAARLSIRAVQHTVGPLYDATTLELVSDAVSPIWREFGLSAPPAAGMFGGTTLAVCPPSLDQGPADGHGVLPLRPTELPKSDPAPLPHEFDEPDRPLVYVTLGTFSNTNLNLFRLVLDALSDEPVNVVMTVGRDNDPTLLPAPGNAHVAQFLPQADVLPHCTAAVHHAGAGTTFGILAHGLPSVALPQSADNFTIADRLAGTGAAQALSPGEVTADAVRAALRSVLETASYRLAAERLAAEIAAMPPPAEVAGHLTHGGVTERPVGRYDSPT